MKNIFENEMKNCCNRLYRKVATGETERWAMLVEIGESSAKAKNRNDVEVEVERVAENVYKVIEQAPHQVKEGKAGLWGYRNEALIRTYKRGGQLYLKVEEVKKFRPIHPLAEGCERLRDGYIILEWARGSKVLNGSAEEKLLNWIEKELKNGCEK